MSFLMFLDSRARPLGAKNLQSWELPSFQALGVVAALQY
jgi:hypothetical protein